jgi:hypothetical protein
MQGLLTSVRGTVQGLLAASRHVLWYLDWHTRGPEAAREATLR